MYYFKVIAMKSFLNAEFLIFAMQKLERTLPIERTVLTYTDMTFLISGEMHYLYNDEPITLHTGDAILFPPGSVRERLGAVGDIQYASINIRNSGNFEPRLSGVVRNAVTPAAVMQLEALDYAYNTASEFTQNTCLSMACALYYQLLCSAEENQDPVIASVKQYVREHITERISLSDISEHVHWSAEYCSSQFKKRTGKSVTEYINEEKTALAKRMIITGEIKLREISDRLGFSDYGYFNRVFKKITGISPMKYKPKKP